MEDIAKLEMPESIRTPGRTWTRYPEIDGAELSQPDLELSSEGDVEIFQGDRALEEMENSPMSKIEPRENRLTALHGPKPMSVVLLRAEGEGSASIEIQAGNRTSHHLVVEAKRGAELTLNEEFRGSAEVLTGFAEIHVGENATVRYGALEAADAELGYFRRKASVEKHGMIEWLNAKFSGELSRTKIETELVGDGSEAEKLAVWYPTGEQHFDTSLHVFHDAENTRCRMDSRAVVDDSARSVYEGLQKVERGAENTSSFQDEEVLTLSDSAEVDASPKLMIENPEVEASHAAGAGDIDEKMQHYVETRGLSREAAKRLVVKGFFEPVLQEIDLPEMKEAVRAEVIEKLER
jgi:Fe-S cluster assembly protein SufD